MMHEEQWQRLTALFDRLLNGEDRAFVLSSEPDPDVRNAVVELWRHHSTAAEQNYLEAPLEFVIAPSLEPGQVLLDRFEIERHLGSGGMGEVYLALDRRVEERVAIKTIARLLNMSDSVRHRFASEVQSARRVTHPNVCRIHELFEDGDTVFFSMEYLEGVPLSELLGRPISHSRALVLQIANALLAAHSKGVVHGDIKPANIMIVPTLESAIPRAVIMDFGLARALNRAGASGITHLSWRAGTAGYMAPELESGAPPSIRSDIFAFGKVAEALEPGDRLWRECLRSLPGERPESLASIVRRLEGGTPRRYWIGGFVAAAAGAVWYSSREFSRRALTVPPASRLLVNGFRSKTAEMSGARLLRSLVLNALEQSPRIRAITDQDTLPALRRLAANATLPLAGSALINLLAELRASFWIDGDLNQTGGRYSLDVRFMSAPASGVVAASNWRDAANIVALAQSAASWIRRTAGESARSLAANSADIASFTSEVPEALQKYYDGLDRYSAGDMTQALPLLEDAVRLDPTFAQAHSMLALILNSLRRYDDGYRESDVARQLATKLPVRERTWIEMNYFRIAEDPQRSIAAAQRDLSFQPDEPRAHGTLAQLQVMAGDFDGAIRHFREAVRLDPRDWMQSLLLADALVEAGHSDLAISEFEDAQGRGAFHPWLYNGAGSAYMGLERYDDALGAFEKEPLDAINACDLQGARIMKGQLDLATSAMQEQLARARNPVELHQAHEYLCGLHFIAGRLEQARQHVRELANLPAFPLMARRFSGAASWARRLDDEATLARIAASTSEIAERWKSSLTESVAAHARGLELWRRNPSDAEPLLLEACGKAYGIWSVFDLAEFYTLAWRWKEAENRWDQFEKRRGTVLVKAWFPGILVLGWFYRASVAESLGNRSAALHYSKKVLDHWASSNPRLAVVQAAVRIHAQSKPL